MGRYLEIPEGLVEGYGGHSKRAPTSPEKEAVKGVKDGCHTPNDCGWALKPSYRLRRPQILLRCTKAGAVAAPNSIPVNVGVNAAKVCANAKIVTVLVTDATSLTTRLPCAVLPMASSREMMIPRALW